MNPIAGPQPIQDIAQPGEPAGGPERSSVTMHAAPGNVPEAHTNPIAGGTLARPVPAAAPPVAEKELEQDLKAVSKEVKNTPKKPAGPAKPIIEIILAVLVALGLAGAAYFAFKS